MRSSDVLARHVHSGELVRIGRHRLDPSDVFSTGFVMGISDKLVLLQKLSDRIDLDGFELLRRSDITSANDEFRRKKFYHRALAMKGIEPAPHTSIDVSNMKSAITTIAEAYPLVVVSRERAFPDEVTIGRVQEVKNTGFRFQYITTLAELEEGSTFEEFAGITSLEFGGEYEETLALVAGLRAHPGINGSMPGATPRLFYVSAQDK